jgi:hypothetical protein
MTGAASDPLDWQPHVRNKPRRAAIANRFKDPADQLRLVIVRDMWLTGFDVPPLHTMYVDKPMRAHGLSQPSARHSRSRVLSVVFWFAASSRFSVGWLTPRRLAICVCVSSASLRSCRSAFASRRARSTATSVAEGGDSHVNMRPCLRSQLGAVAGPNGPIGKGSSLSSTSALRPTTALWARTPRHDARGRLARPRQRPVRYDLSWLGTGQPGRS